MKIINESLLKEYRRAGECELCGKSCKKREPHHIVARGMGGGRRMDIRCNLMAVGSTRGGECHCHSLIETPNRYLLCLEKAAARDGCTADQLQSVHTFILRLDKDSSKVRIVEELCKLPEVPRRIAEKELREAGKL